MDKIDGGVGAQSAAGEETTGTGRRIQLEADNGSIMNPLKGLRDLYKPDRERGPGTLTKFYFPWNWLETRAEDGVDRILEVSERSFGSILSTGRRAIPRVFLQWPRSEEKYFHRGAYWPEDLEDWRYDGSRFLDRVTRLIGKLGEAWDADERVGYVELGLVGDWGEHHHPRIAGDLQRVMGEAYRSAFKRKRLMQRYPDDFAGFRFGLHWDSFAHPGESDKEAMLFQEPWVNRWKTEVIGGEMGYNWGRMWARCPLEGVRNHFELLQERIHRLHVNHLDFWIRYSNLEEEEIRERVLLLNNSLGYHFRIEEAFIPEVVCPGEPFQVSFRVSNLGASPFYYPWQLQLAVLREDGSDDPVLTVIDRNVDIREWMPDSPPRVVQLESRLPSGFPEGARRLALTVLDPASGKPGIRFANKGHDANGRLLLGTFRVADRP
jgi:hypothetical protein